MAQRKRGRPKKAESVSSPSDPVVEHDRIACIRCKSTDVDRICESRKPLKLTGYTVRWYRRRCRVCQQTFTTKEKTTT